MATCDSPPMVPSRQQEHGGQRLDTAAEDNSVDTMETSVANSNNVNNNQSLPATTGEPKNGLGEPTLSPLRSTATPTTVSATNDSVSEQSRKESFTTGNKGNVTGTLPGVGGGAALGSDCSAPATSPVAPAKEIPCNECSSSFSSLQKYMEHHCPNGRLHSARGHKEGEEVEGMIGEESEDEVEHEMCAADVGGMNSEVEMEDDSDVENLCSDIIYQPDGSAFILEDSKEQRGNQGGLSAALQFRGLLSPQTFPNAQVNSGQSGLSPGGERLDQPAAPMSFYPQIINTFHIASSLGSNSLATDHPSFQNTSAGGLAGASPVLHTFRVYDLRHKNDKDYLTVDGAAKNSCVSKDVPNNVDLSKFEGCVADGRRKPVLMCFLCKLSFGYSRSFVTHAVHDHRMTLNDAEQKLLSNKHVSAIIQGIGKDKEPLISFLEPKKPPNSGLTHFPTSANFLGPDAGLRGLWNAFHNSGDNADCLQAGFAFLKGSASSSSNDQTPRTQSMPKAETNPNIGGGAGAHRTPGGSSAAAATGGNLEVRNSDSDCKGHIRDTCTLQPNGPDLSQYPAIKREPGSVGGESLEHDEDSYSNGGGLEMEADEEEEQVLTMAAMAGQRADSTSSKDFPLLNQSISPLSNSVLKLNSDSKGPASASSSSLPVYDKLEMEKSRLSTALAAARERESSNDSTGEALAGRDGSSPSSHPLDMILVRRDDESPGPLHQHLGNPSTPGTPGTPSTPGPGEGSPGSGVECPKCDTVLGSSRSLGGHMTMMHSRNSCKTLKCPKCNWHYKYQQTLDAHMKEKHPESGGSCVYCRTGQPHPRLARGESYTCGYKPFRCEVGQTIFVFLSYTGSKNSEMKHKKNLLISSQIVNRI